ncbi:hypothetical protein N7474_003157 [Penicillium riverlandense]|uniref:uncharacterized protein n=1 Tax=Penicillium riverlandense TaxID=1903569 RepID=UPI002546F1FC|nr:uncharacterized protein N7474_003157 [Penicillium riverlandense]KAJ5826019.1 hypothetical protein N7474_003157 [Penicillium riverlandense]
MSDLPQLQGDVIVSKTSTPLYRSVSRWSDTGILERPALIIVPESEDDILAAIDYSTKNALQLLPAGGGHGSFVPITSKTLYLDLKRFDKVEVDGNAQTVTVGGGAVTSQLVKACTDQGFYTTWVNSNAVGVVGSILGGGNPTMGGLHGMMIDHVLSVRLITAEGRPVEVSPSSTGNDLALFNALCGAGNGLGVITSLTMRIFPLNNLQLSEQGVWIRRLIFPESAIELAARVFDKLQPPPPPLVVAMVCARAPPSAPKPGAPMIILTVTYYGPPDHAEAIVPVLFDEEIVAKTISAQTVLTPMSKLNDSLAHLDVHGGFKDIQSAWVKETHSKTIVAAFGKWLDFTTQHEDARRTTIVLSSFNTQKQIEISNTAEGQARYCSHRDRGTQALIISWFTEERTKLAAADFAKGIKALYRQGSSASELPRTILNNFGPDTKLSELHTGGRVGQLKRLANFWDPTGLFWKPWNQE